MTNKNTPEISTNDVSDEHASTPPTVESTASSQATAARGPAGATLSRRAWLGGAAATAAAGAVVAANAAVPVRTSSPAEKPSAPQSTTPQSTTTQSTTTQSTTTLSTSSATQPGKSSAARMPVIYLPHGGGPCFFMDWTMGPADTWHSTAAWLRALPAQLPTPPKALLVVSAHWEETVPTVTAAPQHHLLYDYSGFPKHTYALKWPAPGAPKLAAQVRQLLAKAQIKSASDLKRGLDHGVFIPLKVAFPAAQVPTIQLSLQRGLDPATHLAIGKALAPLRDQGVLIVGSGMSYHNMRGFGRAASLAHSKAFDGWLDATIQAPAAQRAHALSAWLRAPSARACHPREEHLLPLMVAAGAAEDDPGTTVFRDVVMGVQVAAHQFGTIRRG